MSIALRMTKRADFVSAKANGISVATSGLVLQVIKTPDYYKRHGTIRIGFTASSRLGNSVKRNRIKRRLRAAARAVMEENASVGNDYVIIGRFRAFDRDFSALVKDLKYALHKTGTHKKHG